MKKTNKKELEIVTRKAKWVFTILLIPYIVIKILTIL